MPARRRTALPAAALLAVLAGCTSSGGGPAPWGTAVGPGEVAQVDVSVPEAGAAGGLHDAYEVDVAPDGSLVAALYSGSESAVVRVVGDEVVTRAPVSGRVVEVVPRPDGSVVVLSAEEEGTQLSIGVLPPGGDAEDGSAVELRPLEPRVDLDEGEYAHRSALEGVLGTDGESVVLALPEGEDAHVLLAADPATGDVLAEQDLGGGWVHGLHVDAPREELVVVVGAPGSTEVHRLPTDLSARDPEPVVLDADVWVSALDEDGVLSGVGLEIAEDDDDQRQFASAQIVALPPDSDEAEVRETAIADWPDLPQGDVDVLGVDPGGSTLYVGGHYGEDTDNPQPYLVVVDLGSGDAEAVDLAGWGFPHHLVVSGDVVVTAGSTRLDGGEAAAALWLYGRG